MSDNTLSEIMPRLRSVVFPSLAVACFGRTSGVGCVAAFKDEFGLHRIVFPVQVSTPFSLGLSHVDSNKTALFSQLVGM